MSHTPPLDSNASTSGHLSHLTSRRSALAKVAAGGAAGAALWVAPSVLTFSGTGAAAATCHTCVPGSPTALTFPTGWTAATTGTWAAGSGALGYYASQPAPYNTLVPIFIVEQDPNLSTNTATYTRTLTLDQNRTYTFTFNWAWRSHSTHTRPQTLTVRIRTAGPPAGAWVNLLTFTTTVGAPYQTNYITSAPTFATGTDCLSYEFQFLHSFPSASGTGIYNDIAEAPPSLSCV